MGPITCRRIAVACTFLTACIFAGAPLAEASSRSPRPGSEPQRPVEPERLSVIMSIPAIAGKTKADVEALLGEPSSCTTTKHGEKCEFDWRRLEIVCINGLADWITVNSIKGQPFSPSSLVLLGINKANPTAATDFSIRWDHIPGYVEVSVFPYTTGVADYAYIKVKTK